MKTMSLSLWLSLSAGLAFAAHSAQSLPAPVARFADAYTVGAARVDLGAFVPQAWSDAILEAAPDQKEMLAGPLEQFTQGAQGWLDAFREAGGREVFFLLSLSYLGMEPPVLVVAPVAEGQDPASVEALLTPMVGGINAECRVIDHCVVAAPSSVWKTRESSSLRPASPNLAAAFEGSTSDLMQVAFVPYAEAARVLEEMIPRLPTVVGGGSITALSRGLQWVNLSLEGPPAVELEVLVQSEDAKSAAGLHEVWKRGLSALGTVPEVRENVSKWPDIQAALTPVVGGDALRVHLSQEQITAIARQLLVPALADAREKAARVTMLNQLKQIALALVLYANDHEQNLPSHLAEALPYLGTVEVLLLPDSSVKPPSELQQWNRDAQATWVDEHTPFVLRLPGASMKSIASPATTIMVYQKPETVMDGFVGAAFADGHAELMTIEALQEKLK